MNHDILFVILNLNKYDLKFAFSFRKLNNYCKNTTEYCLTKVYNHKIEKNYVCNNIQKFIYLKKLYLSNDELKYLYNLFNNFNYILEHFKYVKTLYLSADITCLKLNNTKINNITKIYSNNASNINDIIFTNLHSLEVLSYFHNISLKHTNLYFYSSIFYRDLKHMYLHTLETYSSSTFEFENYTVYNFDHMYNLYKLDIQYDKVISFKINKFKNLVKLNCNGNSNQIDTSVMKNLEKLSIIENEDINIIKKLNLKKVTLYSCIDKEEDIKDVQLYKLKIFACFVCQILISKYKNNFNKLQVYNHSYKN